MADRLYAERYTKLAGQSMEMFRRLADRVKKTGKVQPSHKKNRRIQRHVQDEKSPDILAVVALDSLIANRKRAIDAGTSL